MSQVSLPIFEFKLLIEAERFNKDFSAVDKKVREVDLDRKHEKHANLRNERFEREQNRWNNMERIDKQGYDRIEVRKDLY